MNRKSDKNLCDLLTEQVTMSSLNFCIFLLFFNLSSKNDIKLVCFAFDLVDFLLENRYLNFLLEMGFHLILKHLRKCVNCVYNYTYSVNIIHV